MIICGVRKEDVTGKPSSVLKIYSVTSPLLRFFANYKISGHYKIIPGLFIDTLFHTSFLCSEKLMRSFSMIYEFYGRCLWQKKKKYPDLP